MLDTPAARLVREHRKEVARAERLRAFAAASKPPTPLKPQRKPINYVPDLSAVPVPIIEALRRAIASIEKHDALAPSRDAPLDAPPRLSPRSRFAGHCAR